MRRAIVGVAFCILACVETSRTNARDSAAESTAALDSAKIKFDVARGESAFVHGSFDSARMIWQETLSTPRLSANPAIQARVLTWMGLASYRLGDYSSARTHGEHALAIKQRLGMKDELFKSYNALGLLAWNQGRLQEAVRLYRDATGIAQQTGDEASIAKAANNLGLVYQELAEFDSARAGFEQAIEVGTRTSNGLMAGRALTNLASLNIDLGNPVAAVSELDSARKLFRKVGDRTGEQNALGQLGWALYTMGDPGSALTRLDSALTLSRSQGLRQEESSNLELLAAVHRKAGRLRSALGLYKQAAGIDDELGLIVEQGINLRQTAEIHAQLRRLDLAATEARQALALHRSNDARSEQIRDLLTLSSIKSSSGAPLDSLTSILDEAWSLAIGISSRPARVEVALARASIALDKGRGRDVIKLISGSKDDVTRGNYSDEATAASLVARAYFVLGIPDSAALWGRRAINALERVRQRFSSPVFRESFTADQVSVYSHQVDVLMKLNQPEEAFDVSDATRNRALIENVSLAPAAIFASAASMTQPGDGERLLKRIDVLVARLDEMDEADEKDDPALVSRKAELTSQLASARTSYEDMVSRASAERRRGMTMLGARVRPAHEVRSVLTADEALVEFLLTEDRLFTFFVRSTGITAFSQPVKRADLDRRVRLLREAVNIAGDTRDNTAAMFASLNSILIDPLEQRGLLKGLKRLILVPHGSLNYVPYAALRPAASSRYLVEDYSLAEVPSASSLIAIRSAGMSRSAHAVNRVAVFIPFPAELPGTVSESKSIREVSKIYTEFRDNRATESALRSAMKSDGVVHLATHGSMNSLNPLFSRVELAPGKGGSADDGRIEVYELLSVRIASDLVFLSGCETGLGAQGSSAFARGDDYATLSQAFILAGARAVAGTIWKVNDKASAIFAARFYASLSPAGPVESLATAQRQMIRDNRYSNPYYWAGYQVSPWYN